VSRSVSECFTSCRVHGSCGTHVTGDRPSCTDVSAAWTRCGHAVCAVTRCRPQMKLTWSCQAQTTRRHSRSAAGSQPCHIHQHCSNNVGHSHCTVPACSLPRACAGAGPSALACTDSTGAANLAGPAPWCMHAPNTPQPLTFPLVPPQDACGRQATCFTSPPPSSAAGLTTSAAVIG
jgi:hypothetical protein